MDGTICLMKPIHALAPGDALRCPHCRRWHGLELNNVRDATTRGSRLSASCCACATAVSFIGRQSHCGLRAIGNTLPHLRSSTTVRCGWSRSMSVMANAGPGILSDATSPAPEPILTSRLACAGPRSSVHESLDGDPPRIATWRHLRSSARPASSAREWRSVVRAICRPRSSPAPVA
jgi:hypothetical protein